MRGTRAPPSRGTLWSFSAGALADAALPPPYTGEVFLGRSITTHKNVSEATLQKVDAEIRRIIDTQYKLARRLIEDNRDKVEIMSQALMDWETIDAEQIKDILEGRAPRAPKPLKAAAPPAEPPPAATTPAAPAAGT